MSVAFGFNETTVPDTVTTPPGVSVSGRCVDSNVWLQSLVEAGAESFRVNSVS